MIATWYCDTEEELEIEIEELNNNPDFTFIGNFNMIQDIELEFEEYGIYELEFEQMTQNRYGTCIEILEYASDYTVFVGDR